ncbi:MAG: UDP-N-acetylglucosamine--N-acetylmuramyl-(pentapeptide) pyrophosphoryl-undecaprenol N-acetylglucosamine transferase [Clostridia bacterium]|nr:UDP-N-acetylglucosamine--N-acetylmuramyl-(pentapeptide) pyrophosphoryl-undecaprenol N-acetylglucosamine transferase [Clostridia bacterium]
MKNLVFTGGGTAGHVMPNIALIEELSKKYNIYYIAGEGMEKNLLAPYMKSSNISYITIQAPRFVRKLSFSHLKLPFSLIKCINRCKKELTQIKPSAVFSKGGYVSFPVSYAALELNIPLIIHESDYSFGLANKLLAKKAVKVFSAFPSGIKGTQTVGIPLRKSIYEGDRQAGVSYLQSLYKEQNTIDDREKGNIYFCGKRPLVLVLGGSLGAKALNNIVTDNIGALTAEYDFCLISGKGKRSEVCGKGFCQVEFTDRIQDLYLAADVVVCRAGANSLFELLALNKRLILIPLEKQSRGEQKQNAAFLEQRGYATVIEEGKLSVELLLAEIKKAIATIPKKPEFQIDAKRDIVDYIIRAVEEN